MPRKKQITYQSLTPPTAASPLFSQAEEVSRLVEMTPYQRRERVRQKKRNKEAFDFRPEMSQLIDEIVESFKDTPMSITPFSKSALVPC